MRVISLEAAEAEGLVRVYSTARGDLFDTGVPSEAVSIHEEAGRHWANGWANRAVVLAYGREVRGGDFAALEPAGRLPWAS